MLIFYISIFSIIWSLIQCVPIEIFNDNESPLPLPSPSLTEFDDHTPILILSQTESSSPDGSFSYR